MCVCALGVAGSPGAWDQNRAVGPSGTLGDGVGESSKAVSALTMLPVPGQGCQEGSGRPPGAGWGSKTGQTQRD